MPDDTVYFAFRGRDLLVLPGGALVPLRFVVRSDERTITVEVPEGLFE